MPFQIIRNDITKVSADAIVNTANPAPTYAGGTDAAIYEAAGAEELLRERKKIGVIQRGDAVATSAFRLPAKYIIHTVGPVWIDGKSGEYEILHSCYRKSLELADSLHCESIAFPLIATGVYGFPKDKALQIATQEIQAFLFEHEMEVLLVVFNREAFELSGRVYADIDSFVDENYVESAAEKEYARDEIFLDLETQETDVRARGENYARIRRQQRLLRSRKDAGERDRQQQEERERREEKMPDAAGKEAAEPSGTPGFSDILSGAKSTADLDRLMDHPAETFQQRLFYLIDRSGLTDVEVYKRANVSKKVFSTIRSKANYHPSKQTALAFAVALKLDIRDTEDLLARSGYALSSSSRSDLIIGYCIAHRVYDIFDVNCELFKRGLPTLGQ